MKIIIDRFEGNFAVVELENKDTVNVPKQILPDDAKEGTVLAIEIDHLETETRKRRISEKMNELWSD
ncbi:MAG: DUF3006 domain-containing protein [Clostridiales bacterium]|nr:DUF3006 domain-containing protein [Clostridiales bacterium]